jgi:hypothetical protein
MESRVIFIYEYLIMLLLNIILVRLTAATTTTAVRIAEKITGIKNRYA